MTRKRLFEILEMAPAGDLTSKIFDCFIVFTIAINVICTMLETVSSLESYLNLFHTIEVVSLIIFTIEYILRILTCVSVKEYSHWFWGRLLYARTPLSLIDLVAIAPFYFPFFMVSNLGFIRIIRLFRIFRLFKLARYVESLRQFGNILQEKKEDLFIGIFTITILLVFSSSLMYTLEHEAQPEVFSSIPASMWWGVATLTTVGYGDTYPVTTAGKFVGAIISILGIGLFAVPAGILSSAYLKETQEKDLKICPHCKETYYD